VQLPEGQEAALTAHNHMGYIYFFKKISYETLEAVAG
jgi:hypothetical protein